jgi:hypothetical protein
MSKVHKLSPITTIPELELFTVPATQAAVEKNVDCVIRPIAPVQGAKFIQFNFPASQDLYLLFHESYLHLKLRFKLMKTTAATDADWTKDSFYPANYLLHSLFKQVELVVGDEELVKGPPTYMYKAYFEALLGFSERSKKTNLACALWNATEADRVKVISPSVASKTGPTIDLVGRLHLDMTFQNKALLGGCVTGIKFALNDPNFCIINAENSGVTPTIEIMDAWLELNCLKVYPHIVEAHEKALSIGTAKYPMNRCEVKTITVPTGLQNVTLDNIIHGLLPRRVFVAMVDNDAFNGDIKKDPFQFKHYNINSIASFIDGEQFPTKAYQPDFKNNNFTREYMALLRTLNQNTTDVLLDITKDDYKDKCCIFAFNYTPDMTNGLSGISHTSIQKRGTFGLHMNFSEPLPNAINILIYCEFDTIIEIGQDRHPKLNYT